MIAALVVIALGVLALAYVARALKEDRRGLAPEEPHTTEVEETKRLALEGLVDLEEERDAGKLAPDDYERLRRAYELEAVEALRRADAINKGEGEDDVELEIARVKERLRCPTCGTIRPPEDPCPRCGG